MQQYLVIIEKAANNYSAFIPDVPGCIATGNTIDAVISAMQDALEFHIEGMIVEGISMPQPQSLKAHLEQGSFNPDKIGQNYFIGNITASQPGIAA